LAGVLKRGKDARGVQDEKALTQKSGCSALLSGHSREGIEVKWESYEGETAKKKRFYPEGYSSSAPVAAWLAERVSG